MTAWLDFVIVDIYQQKKSARLPQFFKSSIFSVWQWYPQTGAPQFLAFQILSGNIFGAISIARLEHVKNQLNYFFLFFHYGIGYFLRPIRVWRISRMKAPKWNEKYSVHVEEIDVQYKRLFDIIGKP